MMSWKPSWRKYHRLMCRLSPLKETRTERRIQIPVHMLSGLKPTSTPITLSHVELDIIYLRRCCKLLHMQFWKWLAGRDNFKTSKNLLYKPRGRCWEGQISYFDSFFTSSTDKNHMIRNEIVIPVFSCKKSNLHTGFST